MAWASVETDSVLATPGTPSSRQWPRASRHTSMRSTIRSCPTTTRLTSKSTCSRVAVGGRIGSSAGRVTCTVLQPGLDFACDLPEQTRDVTCHDLHTHEYCSCPGEFHPHAAQI